MARTRITILWTIVIVFISQLFHCAYTNQRDQGILSTSSNLATNSNNKGQGLHSQQTSAHPTRQQAQHHHHHPQALPRNYDYEQPIQRGSQLASQLSPASGGNSDRHRETYEELVGSSSGGSLDEAQDFQQPVVGLQQQQPQAPSTRDRCRELISLPLLSFRDLAPDERISEEAECANLREQIAAANRRANQVAQFSSAAQQLQPPRAGQRSRGQQAAVVPQEQPQLEPIAEQEQPGSGGLDQAGSAGDNGAPLAAQDEEYPLAPPIQLRGGQLVATRGRQFPAASQLFAGGQIAEAQPSNASSSFAGWPPRSSYATQLQSMLLQQQHSPRRSQQGATRQQFYQPQPATLNPNTQPPTTTFEPLFETTEYPTTTSSTTTTTTTTTTTPAPPRIRVGAGGRRRHSGGRAMGRSTTTTTTTTTTQKPSTLADYADGSDLPTDYYDEYDDQQQTTTTTTTSRPNRRGGGGGGRRQGGGGRRHRQQTTPKPTSTTTTTTLSPGYQPRPDGRIIDYMADPNFPRELKGADLTNYPFYISVPEKIDFECKGRHDGYYTNIDLHCQIYHHCAVGNRYDFLCPNYTLFDQTTFTCRFINTVDCPGSEKHFDRNNALYVEKDDKGAGNAADSSSTTSTTTTTTTTTQAPRLNIQLSNRNGAGSQQGSNANNNNGPTSALAIIKNSRAGSGFVPAGGGANRNRRATGNQPTESHGHRPICHDHPRKCNLPSCKPTQQSA